MSSTPLVSVICLCYNQARFVEEAIHSVLQQTYPNIELIVVDDASSDDSRQMIEKVLAPYPRAKFIALETNIGNCRAFNKGWRESAGEFIIDLAADDLLMPKRVERGVEAFARHDVSYGVSFSNAELVAGNGAFLKYHYNVDPSGLVKMPVPQGDVFLPLIQRYFICAPTMMYRRSVLDRLGGYDESLSYEDFDFWVRSSRLFKYVYTDEVLVKKRIVKGSKSQLQFKVGSKDFSSTYKVCVKAAALVASAVEKHALKKRVFYELRQALRFFDFKTALCYLALLKNL